jgi:hypothetical protein
MGVAGQRRLAVSVKPCFNMINSALGENDVLMKYCAMDHQSDQRA